MKIGTLVVLPAKPCQVRLEPVLQPDFHVCPLCNEPIPSEAGYWAFAVDRARVYPVRTCLDCWTEAEAGELVQIGQRHLPDLDPRPADP